MTEKLKEILRRIKKYIGIKLRKLQKIFIYCFLRFSRWRYAKVAVIICSITILAGGFIGYHIGKFGAERKAVKNEETMVAQYEDEKSALEQSYQEQLEEEKKQQLKKKKRPWNLTLVNDTHPMQEGYVPELADIGDGQKVDKRIAKNLKKMLKDAEKEGLQMVVCSSYRSVEKQKELYNTYIGNEVAKGKDYWTALEETIQSTAFPGKSEHNLGLAVDIVSAQYMKLDKKQEQTKEAKWLAENCYKYGFILRYPVDKTEITGIIYEPWHYRYVGVSDATKIMEQGLTLEEYLEEN